MGRRENGWAKQLPDDWAINKGYHGFGRINSMLVYSVRLSVSGKQHEITQCKTQEEAAKAYDAALWRLQAFAPRSAEPNFPDDFNSISLDDVDALCPFAHTLFETAMQEVISKGINPVDFVRMKTAERELYKKSKSNSPVASNEFEVYETEVGKLTALLVSASLKLSKARIPVVLTKLPAVSAKADAASAALIDSINKLNELQEILKSHRGVYPKMKALAQGSPDECTG